MSSIEEVAKRVKDWSSGYHYYDEDGICSGQSHDRSKDHPPHDLFELTDPAAQLAEWVEKVLAAWGEFGGDLMCSSRCRFGYLDNEPGSDREPANCRCGRVELERLLDDGAVEVPSSSSSLAAEGTTE